MTVRFLDKLKGKILRRINNQTTQYYGTGQALKDDFDSAKG